MFWKLPEQLLLPHPLGVLSRTFSAPGAVPSLWQGAEQAGPTLTEPLGGAGSPNPHSGLRVPGLVEGQGSRESPGACGQWTVQGRPPLGKVRPERRGEAPVCVGVGTGCRRAARSHSQSGLQHGPRDESLTH